MFNPRLVGVPCDQAEIAIVTQIKAMGSYKVRILKQNFNLMSSGNSHHVKPDLCMLATQLGPFNVTLIQANHTSAFGQKESVNFTMISTSMSIGCRIEASQMCVQF